MLDHLGIQCADMDASCVLLRRGARAARCDQTDGLRRGDRIRHARQARLLDRCVRLRRGLPRVAHRVRGRRSGRRPGVLRRRGRRPAPRCSTSHASGPSTTPTTTARSCATPTATTSKRSAICLATDAARRTLSEFLFAVLAIIVPLGPGGSGQPRDVRRADGDAGERERPDRRRSLRGGCRARGDSCTSARWCVWGRAIALPERPTARLDDGPRARSGPGRVRLPVLSARAAIDAERCADDRAAQDGRRERRVRIRRRLDGRRTSPRWRCSFRPPRRSPRAASISSAG